MDLTPERKAQLRQAAENLLERMVNYIYNRVYKGFDRDDALSALAAGFTITPDLCMSHIASGVSRIEDPDNITFEECSAVVRDSGFLPGVNPEEIVESDTTRKELVQFVKALARVSRLYSEL